MPVSNTHLPLHCPTIFIQIFYGYSVENGLLLNSNFHGDGICYLLTNWPAYLYGRIQSPRLDVMPDRREGITRAAGFGFARIDTQAS